MRDARQAQVLCDLHVEMSWQAQHLGSWKLSSATLVRGISGELDEELATLQHNFSARSIWRAGRRTGDFVVQLFARSVCGAGS